MLLSSALPRYRQHVISKISETAKQQEQLQKDAREDEQRQKNLVKQQAAQERRTERARVKESKAAEAAKRAASKERQLHNKAASQQLNNALQLSTKKTRNNSKPSATQRLQELVTESPTKPEEPNPPPQQQGRTRRPPAYLSDYEVSR